MLRNVDGIVGVDVEQDRADQLDGPSRDVFSLLSEHLDPVVFPVGDQHPFVPVNPDTVGQPELTSAFVGAAGLGEGFSGHSGRIGMARRMVAAGAPNAAVQNQGRWKHGDMVARYTRARSQEKR